MCEGNIQTNMHARIGVQQSYMMGTGKQQFHPLAKSMQLTNVEGNRYISFFGQTFKKWPLSNVMAIVLRFLEVVIQL